MASLWETELSREEDRAWRRWTDDFWPIKISNSVQSANSATAAGASCICGVVA